MVAAPRLLTRAETVRYPDQLSLASLVDQEVFAAVTVAATATLTAAGGKTAQGTAEVTPARPTTAEPPPLLTRADRTRYPDQLGSAALVDVDLLATAGRPTGALPVVGDTGSRRAAGSAAVRAVSALAAQPPAGAALPTGVLRVERVFVADALRISTIVDQELFGVPALLAYAEGTGAVATTANTVADTGNKRGIGSAGSAAASALAVTAGRYAAGSASVAAATSSLADTGHKGGVGAPDISAASAVDLSGARGPRGGPADVTDVTVIAFVGLKRDAGTANPGGAADSIPTGTKADAGTADTTDTSTVDIIGRISHTGSAEVADTATGTGAGGSDRSGPAASAATTSAVDVVAGPVWWGTGDVEATTSAVDVTAGPAWSGTGDVDPAVSATGGVTGTNPAQGVVADPASLDQAGNKDVSGIGGATATAASSASGSGHVGAGDAGSAQASSDATAAGTRGRQGAADSTAPTTTDTQGSKTDAGQADVTTSTSVAPAGRKQSAAPDVVADTAVVADAGITGRTGAAASDPAGNAVDATGNVVTVQDGALNFDATHALTTAGQGLQSATVAFVSILDAAVDGTRVAVGALPAAEATTLAVAGVRIPQGALIFNTADALTLVGAPVRQGAVDYLTVATLALAGAPISVAQVAMATGHLLAVDAVRIARGEVADAMQLDLRLAGFDVRLAAVAFVSLYRLRADGLTGLVHRPRTGYVIRPRTGTVVRPRTGVVARP